MKIPYQAPQTNYKYNEIAHFKELVVGAGTKVFKANNSGVFAGSASYGSAPFKLSYAGALTATSGAIGGWTLGSSYLLSGTGTTTVGLDSGGTNPAFYAGSATPGSAPFRVTASGALTATDATITGAITATSGSIGSFTIGDYLYTGSKTAYNDSNAGVHIGGDGIGIGNNIFTVSAAGALIATSATITGAITATSGDISGDLTVTGSLLSDDGSAFQTKIEDGKVSFLKSSAEKAYIKTATDSSSLAIASGDRIYFTKTSGSPLLNIDQDSNITIASDAFIIWASGRKLTASGSKIECNGDFDVTGGYKVDDDAGITKTFSGVTDFNIVIKGGIITSFTDNS